MATHSLGSKKPLTEFFAAYDAAEKTLRAEFFEFLRFASVSSEPQHTADVRKCADWVAAFLKDAGMNVEVWEGPGHPTIYAEWLGAPGKPTALIYNHYDVQPVDPLELWTSPPFEPRVENGEVFARGAEDNKGQCFYVIAAVRWWLKTHGRLPINVKLCIEGEEETGSGTITKLLPEKREKVKADYVYIVDLGFHEIKSPALTLGVRGITTMTAELEASRTDLHSGLVGGMVYNPNRALAEMLAKCYAPDGRIAIPGFYDDVEEVNASELKAINFAFDENGFTQMFGTPANGGEKSFTPVQRAWVRPTFEINGIIGGYTGEGFKTVIPARAMAKLSCRLVPNQTPGKITALVESFLQSLVPGGMKLSLHRHAGGGPAIRTKLDARAVRITADVLTELAGKPCEYILSGGSIPIVPALAEASGGEVVMMGFGLPDDNIHAPNEHFGLDRIRSGFATVAAMLERLGV